MKLTFDHLMEFSTETELNTGKKTEKERSGKEDEYENDDPGPIICTGSNGDGRCFWRIGVRADGQEVKYHWQIQNLVSSDPQAWRKMILALSPWSQC